MAYTSHCREQRLSIYFSLSEKGCSKNQYSLLWKLLHAKNFPTNTQKANRVEVGENYLDVNP